MSKQKVTVPQTIIAFVLLGLFMYGLWYSFLGPGSEPPPHRLSAPLPGEEDLIKAKQAKTEPKPEASAKKQAKQPEKTQKPASEQKSPHE